MSAPENGETTPAEEAEPGSETAVQAAADEELAIRDEGAGRDDDASGEEESEEGEDGEGEDQGDLFSPKLSDDRLRSVIESIVFASDKPVSLAVILSTLGRIKRSRVREALKQMIEEGDEQERSGTRGFVLREVAGGYQYRTIADNAFWLKKLQKERPWRMTQAALEVLATVAYKQPITKGEIDALRGVDSGAVLSKLVDKRLIKPVGRKEVPGYPMQYGTSDYFLEFFGLKSTGDLPTLREIKELTEIEDEVEIPEEVRQFEEERRRQIEAEQDALASEVLDEIGEGEEAEAAVDTDEESSGD